MSAKPLSRVRRLADGAVFQALLRKGRRRVQGAVAAKVLDGGDARTGAGRLGLSIAKRHLRKAIDRNRMKRQVREAYRQRGQRLDGMDVLFMLAEGSKAREELKRVPAELHTAAGRRRLRSSVEAVLDLIEADGASRSGVGPLSR